eukprot:SAG22_NODE_21596_length_255_cov_1.974359_1_plen_60_part_01
MSRVMQLCNNEFQYKGDDGIDREYANICWLENVEMVCEQALTRLYEFKHTRGTARGKQFS